MLTTGDGFANLDVPQLRQMALCVRLAMGSSFEASLCGPVACDWSPVRSGRIGNSCDGMVDGNMATIGTAMLISVFSDTINKF